MRLFVLLFCVLSLTSCANLDANTIGQVAGVLLNEGGVGGSLTPSNTEVAGGLKESLSLGVDKAVKGLSLTDGFLKNAAIKILFPPEVGKVEQKMRALGMGSLCDSFVTSLNRAAEKASSQAGPIFLGAIKKMTFQDAMNILLGGDGSATNYLVKATTPEIKKMYNPVIMSSLNKVNATKYWGDITSTYNAIPFVGNKINTDLPGYVTGKAMDALFGQVRLQESLIRKNPLERSSALLKKVFGYADTKKN